MLQVTWEWLGMAPALDLANTVAIEGDDEHDLIESAEDYAEWARIEAGFLPSGSLRLLEGSRPELMEVRAAVRELLAAVTARRKPPRAAVEALNAASRRAPEWFELDAGSIKAVARTDAGRVDALLARYARSAIELVAAEADGLRRCPAPSCGMFYVSTRGSQRWCSTQCGTRARVARHYRSRRVAGG